MGVYYESDGLIYGSQDADTLFATGQSASVQALGLGGDDSIVFDAYWDGSDSVDGGAGFDVLSITSASEQLYAVQLTDNVDGIEKVLVSQSQAVSTTVSVEAGALAGALQVVMDLHLTTGTNLLATAATVALDVIGSPGHDQLRTGSYDDIFDLTGGGNDSVEAGGGFDTVSFGAALTALDFADGGGGYDILSITGPSAGLGDLSRFPHFEEIALAGAVDHVLIFPDAALDPGSALYINAFAAQRLVFDGSAETSGQWYIDGSAGSDDLRGGAAADQFGFAYGGADTIRGGGGDDTFVAPFGFDRTDRLRGGAGTDTLLLNGAYAGRIAIGPANLQDCEVIEFGAGFDYAAKPAGQV